MRALKQTEFVEISKEIVVTTQAHEGIETSLLYPAFTSFK